MSWVTRQYWSARAYIDPVADLLSGFYVQEQAIGFGILSGLASGEPIVGVATGIAISLPKVVTSIGQGVDEVLSQASGSDDAELSPMEKFSANYRECTRAAYIGLASLVVAAGIGVSKLSSSSIGDDSKPTSANEMVVPD